ncbi:hypothetical protein GGP41_007325 [Bipolaris sorokiniana]|uniref:Uncharacterized protein n=1 Tax=Cochliobolus sativus TaxID=45130 RepID=A0A8H6E1D9_COCSA|nr:hypothetical protein GGP41_007325 [Bipolaris sorokiniana]
MSKLSEDVLKAGAAFCCNGSNHIIVETARSYKLPEDKAGPFGEAFCSRALSKMDYSIHLRVFVLSGAQWAGDGCLFR